MALIYLCYDFSYIIYQNVCRCVFKFFLRDHGVQCFSLWIERGLDRGDIDVYVDRTCAGLEQHRCDVDVVMLTLCS